MSEGGTESKTARSPSRLQTLPTRVLHYAASLGGPSGMTGLAVTSRSMRQAVSTSLPTYCAGLTDRGAKCDVLAEPYATQCADYCAAVARERTQFLDQLWAAADDETKASAGEDPEFLARLEVRAAAEHGDVPRLVELWDRVFRLTRDGLFSFTNDLSISDAAQHLTAQQLAQLARQTIGATEIWRLVFSSAGSKIKQLAALLPLPLKQVLALLGDYLRDVAHVASRVAMSIYSPAPLAHSASMALGALELLRELYPRYLVELDTAFAERLFRQLAAAMARDNIAPNEREPVRQLLSWLPELLKAEGPVFSTAPRFIFPYLLS